MRLGVVVSALLFWLPFPSGVLFAQHHSHHIHLGLGGYGYLPSFYGPTYALAPYGFYASGYTVNGIGPFYLPPVVLGPPMFGPMQNMVGNGGGAGAAMPMQAQPGQFQPGQAQVGGGQAGQPLAGQPQAAPAPAAAPAAERPERKPRVSNLEAKTRAGKFIDAGDRLFRQQRFREALERYKLAVPQAPDMAEIFMRQGFAESAIGQYETALRLFRRGLKIQPKWRPGELRLDDLYGADNKLAKGAHFEALAQQMQAAPHDPHLLFVLGLELEFDGQTERAAPFLLRAGQLGANEDHSLDGFLDAAAAHFAGGPILDGPKLGDAKEGLNAANPAVPGGAAAPADPAKGKGPILDL